MRDRLPGTGYDEALAMLEDKMPYDESGAGGGRPQSRNVMGGSLCVCSNAPVTGFFRSGCCETGPQDHGNHSVCAVMTAEFLAFSKARGNDLSTPRPEYGFAGLRAGDRWCLCAPRWQEAFEAGCAPEVVLEATEAGALSDCRLEDLRARAAG